MLHLYPAEASLWFGLAVLILNQHITENNTDPETAIAAARSAQIAMVAGRNDMDVSKVSFVCVGGVCISVVPICASCIKHFTCYGYRLFFGLPRLYLLSALYLLSFIGNLVSGILSPNVDSLSYVLV